MPIVTCGRRVRRRQPLELLSQVTLIAGHGISGDAYSHPHSARQVLIASTAAYERLNIPRGALKENLLVEEPIDDCASGDALHIGDAVIRLTIPCEPCSRLELVRRGLMKEAAKCRGMLGRVVAGGVIRPGDEVRIAKREFEPLGRTIRERLIDVMNAMPRDHVASISTVLHLTGAPSMYGRFLTSMLRSLPVTAPDRVLSEQALAMTSLPRWDPSGYYG